MLGVKSIGVILEHDYWYIFECDYGDRVREKPFLKGLLRSFDKDFATMIGIVVNNNPYCLQFSIAVNIQGDPIIFEKWLREFYPEKIRRHNVFLRGTMKYNVMTFLDDWMIDLVITEEGNDASFLWPERNLLETSKPQYKCMKMEKSKVFISHSSLDKQDIVNPLYSYFQANNIGSWLDSYEIDYGDNIYLKVNEGIENSEVGVFILTNNFFDAKSGWPITEFSAFFMELMKSNKKVLMVNAGVEPDKMHALMRVFRYVPWDNGAGLPIIANAVKKLLGA